MINFFLSLEYFLSALGDESLVEPFLLAHVKAAAIGGQIYAALLVDVGIVGVALWFGPGQKFLSRQVLVRKKNEISSLF